MCSSQTLHCQFDKMEETTFQSWKASFHSPFSVRAEIIYYVKQQIKSKKREEEY